MSDFLAAVAVAIAGTITFWGIARLVAMLFPAVPRSVSFAAWIVLVWATVVGCGLFLGAFGLLSPFTLHAAVSLLGGASLLISARNVPAPCRHAVGRSDAILDSEARAGRKRRSRIHSMFWLVLCSFWLAYLTLDGLLRLPSDWDSLAYHLPIVDHWIQYGHLYARDCAFWYVPGNNELLAYWFVAPFSGDFWVHLNNVPSVTLLAAATSGAAIQLRVPLQLRMLAILAVLCSQPVIRHIVSAENDVAAVALFLAGTLFGQRFSRWQRPADLLIFALATGLLAGIKYYALGYVAVAVVLTMLPLLGSRQWNAAFRAMSAMGVAVFLLGSFWYIRNWVFTGSPLFPKGFLGMPDLWASMRPDNHTSMLLYGGRPEVYRLLVWAWLGQAGPLSLAAVLSLPLVALRLVWANSGRAVGCWWGVGAIFTAMVYVITPNVIETKLGSLNMLNYQYHPVRFGLPLQTTAVLVSAACVASLCRSHRYPVRAFGRLAYGLFALGAAGTVVLHLAPLHGLRSTLIGWGIHLWQHPALVVSPAERLLLAFNIAIGVAVIAVFVGFSRRRRVAVCILAAFAFCAAAPALAFRWHRHFDAHFTTVNRTAAFAKTLAHMSQRDRLCVCEYRYYATLGSRRQTSVCRPLYLPDEQSFLAYLEQNEATYVLVPDADGHWSAIYAEAGQWVESAPDQFPLVEDYGQFRLHRRIDTRTTAASFSGARSKRVSKSDSPSPRLPAP